MGFFFHGFKFLRKKKAKRKEKEEPIYEWALAKNDSPIVYKALICERITRQDAHFRYQTGRLIR